MRYDELYHFGIKRKSGRYPWGSGKRPYQSGGGPLGLLKKNSSSQASGSKSEGGTEELSEEEIKKRKLEAVRSGDPTEIYKYKEQMTTQELTDAANRVDAIKRIRNASISDLKAQKEMGFNNIDNVMKKVGRVNTWGENALKSVSLARQFFNLFQELSGNQKSSGTQNKNQQQSKQQDSKKKK